MRGRLSAGCAALLALSACSGKHAVVVPDIDDSPRVAAAQVKDIPELVPAYGLAEGRSLVVNIEAEDTPHVHAGEAADAYMVPSTAAVACRVIRVLGHVSAETNQSLAWLKPVGGDGFPPNSFVSANIEVARRRALVVPRPAVMIRNGRTVVLQVLRGAGGKVSYQPVPVSMGAESGGDVEIGSGLKAGDEVVVGEGIGLLFPEFKAAADD